jgi:hypothetical protein
VPSRDSTNSAQLKFGKSSPPMEPYGSRRCHSTRHSPNATSSTQDWRGRFTTCCIEAGCQMASPNNLDASIDGPLFSQAG